jgi:hypothetical protein
MFGVGPRYRWWKCGIGCEINFFSNVAAVFRHLHPAMKGWRCHKCRPMPKHETARDRFLEVLDVN